jgi:poly-gamma-glutamate capsule biosynthesis protein CapA/YwtB (metallophosphatase superfamily)
VLLALVAIGCAGPQPGPPASPAAKKAAGVRILFVGDTSFCEGYQRRLKAAGKGSVLERRGYDYHLSRLDPLLRGAHLVIANLETPLTRRARSALDGKKRYIHRSDPEKAPAALVRHNIRAVSLGNNHAMDYGPDGLRDTLAALKRHGIRHYGAGLDEAGAVRPLTESVRVAGREFRLAVIGGFELRDSYADKFRFYARDEKGGVAGLEWDEMAGRIRKLKAADPELFVVVTPHWGANYGYRRERDAEAARRLIEAGADLVIGHGAHHFQTAEIHRGRWILHNIGNFMFNAPGRYQQRRSHAMSLAICLELRPGKETVTAELYCYPLFSDNLRTGYRSRPVNGPEFTTAWDLIRDRCPDPLAFARSVVIGRDEIGHYLKMKAR